MAGQARRPLLDHRRISNPFYLICFVAGTYRGTLGDRSGNSRLDPVTFELVGDAITLNEPGVVHTRSLGSVRVRVRSNANGLLNAVDSGTVAVVPTATIA